jgi:hypothetical protein
VIRRLAAALPFAVALAIALTLAPAPRVAWARSDRVVVYPTAKVFPAAVRFLRLEAGARIVEKDADAGYVMFEITEGRKTYPGALELIELESAGRPSARIVITIEGQPSYAEVVLLDRLERKLKDELGPPPPTPPTRDRDAPKDPPAPAPPP